MYRPIVNKKMKHKMNESDMPRDNKLRIAAINRFLERHYSDKETYFTQVKSGNDEYVIYTDSNNGEEALIWRPIDNNSYPEEFNEAIEYLTGQGENGEKVLACCSSDRSKYEEGVHPLLFDENHWCEIFTTLLMVFCFSPELKDWSIETFVNIYPMMPKKHLYGVLGNLLLFCETSDGHIELSDLSEFLNAANATLPDKTQAN